MNNTIEFKGYVAHIHYDDSDEIFVGRVMNAADKISFHGESIGELKANFAEVIEGYLQNCAELGIEPEKPCPDSILVRVDPKLQSRINRVVLRSGESRQEWVVGVLTKAVRESEQPNPAAT